MTKFKINKELEIVCEWKKTSRAFKHIAVLFRNGYSVDETKICYVNRTWESFKFESVIQQLLDKTDLLTKRQKTNFLERASKKSREETNAQFRTIASIAKLGEIFCAGDKKATNDWKLRIIKAGLRDKGLTIPDDWGSLSEKEKQHRLNGVISELKTTC